MVLWLGWCGEFLLACDLRVLLGVVLLWVWGFVGFTLGGLLF